MADVMSWVRSHVPTRESLSANRWLAPFAGPLLQPSLWHFNRRSVPRGVALGLLAGLTVPLAHTAVAAALAIPLRANIVVAAVTTWLSNPLTLLLILATEQSIGRSVLNFHHRAVTARMAVDATTAMQGWLAWFLQTSGEIAIGSVLLATFSATIGYFLATLIWRIRIARKWRRRHG